MTSRFISRSVFTTSWCWSSEIKTSRRASFARKRVEFFFFFWFVSNRQTDVPQRSPSSRCQPLVTLRRCSRAEGITHVGLTRSPVLGHHCSSIYHENPSFFQTHTYVLLSLVGSERFKRTFSNDDRRRRPDRSCGFSCSGGEPRTPRAENVRIIVIPYTQC